MNLLEPNEDAPPVELHYTLRLQRDAASRKFLIFAESLAEEQAVGIRAEIQQVADERVADLAKQNTEYWQAMIDAETKLREIETVIGSVQDGLAT